MGIDIETKITAIIPTLNEEVHIAEAIAAVQFADEIIVIDSFSIDQTVAIARSKNVRVIQREFDDFSTQKNYAIAQASYGWIYVLDADERVGQTLKKEILHAVENPGNNVGFYIFRTLYFAGKKIRFSGYQRDKVIRLFKKTACKYDGKLVHEKIVSTGDIGYLKQKIDHYSYRDYDHYLGKLNRYASLKARAFLVENKSVNAYHLWIKPPVRFVIHYFIRLGFLDGFEGLVLAKLQAFGVFSRYVKLRMLRNKVK